LADISRGTTGSKPAQPRQLNVVLMILLKSLGDRRVSPAGVTLMVRERRRV
jgi:hypothetical protein